MVIKVEGYGKLLKFLEGVLKIDLIARTLYHFEGIGRVLSTTGVQRWRPGRAYTSCENTI